MSDRKTLTNDAIKKALPGSILWDEAAPGLHLRSFDNRKSYYLYYRTKGGQQRRPKLGDHPTIALAQARAIAREMLGEVAAGRDPAMERKEQRDMPTLAKLCDTYLELHACRKKSEKEDRRQIAVYIKPRALAAKKVSDIEYTDIARLHRNMAKTPFQANRVVSLLSKMFSLAEKWKYRPVGSNPAKGIERYKERKRRRYLKGDEAYLVAERLRHYESKYPAQVAFLQLLVMTGARPKEIADAKWKQLDGDRLVLTEHKTQEAMDERVIHLPPQVMAVLAKLPRTTGTITGIQNPRHLWNKIRADTGIKNLHMYDLRHNFASAALAAGYTLSQIGELLGHQSTQTTARYAHLVDDAARSASEATANLLEKMMEKAQ